MRISWLWNQEKRAERNKKMTDDLIESPQVQDIIQRRAEIMATNTVRGWLLSRRIRHCAACLSTQLTLKRWESGVKGQETYLCAPHYEEAEKRANAMAPNIGNA